MLQHQLFSLYELLLLQNKVDLQLNTSVESMLHIVPDVCMAGVRVGARFRPYYLRSLHTTVVG